MMSLKLSWNKCFNLSWIKGHLMLLDCILMVLSRGKRKYYLIHGSVIILLDDVIWFCKPMLHISFPLATLFSI